MTRKEFTKRVKGKSPLSEFKKWKFLLKYIPPCYFYLFLSYARRGDSLPKAVYEIISCFLPNGPIPFRMDSDIYENQAQINKDLKKLRAWSHTYIITVEVEFHRSYKICNKIIFRIIITVLCNCLKVINSRNYKIFIFE